jgi:hypothetical protein
VWALRVLLKAPRHRAAPAAALHLTPGSRHPPVPT